MKREGEQWLPAWRLRELVVEGVISSSELIQATLTRIAGVDPWLHSFITVAGDRAMARARDLERELASGATPGPLFGVPISFKDEIWTQGIPSTGGSMAFRDFVPGKEGVVEGRIRQAGAVVVGKTNMPEFASWDRSWNRITPESVNPWDPSRISGASSGGSAAGVAAGLVPLSIGSDGGGSIRIPSALCGVVGLYPMAGRVPSRDSFSYSRAASLGPIARDVRDAATLLHVIAGPDPGDQTSLAEAPPDFLADLDLGAQGLRLAWAPDLGQVRGHAGVIAAAAAAARALQGSGAEVDEPGITFPDVWEPFHLATAAARYEKGPIPFTQTDAFRSRFNDPAQLELLTPYIRRKFAKSAPTRDAWEVAERVRADVRTRLSAWFERYDAILSPTVAWPAPKAPAGWVTPYPDDHMGTNLTAIVNFARATAASFPCGLVEGLPAGVQVIGPPGAEPIVLRICRALEVLVPAIGHPPEVDRRLGVPG